MDEDICLPEVHTFPHPSGNYEFQVIQLKQVKFSINPAVISPSLDYAVPPHPMLSFMFL